MRPHVLGLADVDRSTGRDGGSVDDAASPDRSPTLGAASTVRSSTAPTLAAVSAYDVIPTELRHADATYDVLQRACGRPIDVDGRARHAERIAEQLGRFPDGQFVAVVREGGVERVVGTSATMRTRRPPDAPPLPWRAVIGDYGLPNHAPDGDWLYGVEIAVDPDYQRRGIASALYRVRLALVTELGLKGWYAGGMCMGYHRYAEVLTPRAYAERVLAGELTDPTVTMQLHRGLRPAGIIEGYDPEPKAGGCAVLLVWTPPRTAPAPGSAAIGAAARSRAPRGGTVVGERGPSERRTQGRETQGRRAQGQRAQGQREQAQREQAQRGQAQRGQDRQARHR